MGRRRGRKKTQATQIVKIERVLDQNARPPTIETVVDEQSVLIRRRRVTTEQNGELTTIIEHVGIITPINNDIRVNDRIPMGDTYLDIVDIDNKTESRIQKLIMDRKNY